MQPNSAKVGLDLYSKERVGGGVLANVHKHENSGMVIEGDVPRSAGRKGALCYAYIQSVQFLCEEIRQPRTDLPPLAQFLRQCQVGLDSQKSTLS